MDKGTHDLGINIDYEALYAQAMSELKGAQLVIAAIVKRGGPIEISTSELDTANADKLKVLRIEDKDIMRIELE